MSSPATRLCKLCLQPSALRRSHIIPQWAFDRVSRAHPTEGRQIPVLIQDGVAVQTSNQNTEYLLCESCEQRISRWERYVSMQARQLDGSFPASSSLTNLRQVVGSDGRLYTLGDASTLEKDAITRFAASVVWRASVSRRFTRVRLGDRYEEEFRRFLLDDSQALPSNARLIIEFLDLPVDGHQIDHTIAGPTSEKKGGQHIHSFIVSGIHFKLFVGGMMYTGLDHVCFARTGRVQLSAGERVHGHMNKMVQEATPKGKALLNSGLLATMDRQPSSK